MFFNYIIHINTFRIIVKHFFLLFNNLTNCIYFLKNFMISKIV